MAITKRQSYAIIHPVRAACGPRIGHRLRIDARFWTELVVDADKDVWRSSVGVLNSMGGLQPIPGWPEATKEKAVAIARRLLNGVGDGPDRKRFEERGMLIVVEIPLSGAERVAMLSDAQKEQQAK